jgi:hypothetical protein
LPDPTGAFDFLLDPGQGIIGTLTVLLQAGTKIFSDSGIALNEADIQEGQTGKIDGVLMVSDTEPDLLKAVLIVLDLPGAPELMELRGTASVVDYENQTFDLITDTETVCVKVPEDTPFIVVSTSDEEILNDMILTLDDLNEGDLVKLFGSYDATDCFVPDVIWILVECDDCVIIE